MGPITIKPAAAKAVTKLIQIILFCCKHFHYKLLRIRTWIEEVDVQFMARIETGRNQTDQDLFSGHKDLVI